MKFKPSTLDTLKYARELIGPETPVRIRRKPRRRHLKPAKRIKPVLYQKIGPWPNLRSPLNDLQLKIMTKRGVKVASSFQVCYREEKIRPFLYYVLRKSTYFKTIRKFSLCWLLYGSEDTSFYTPGVSKCTSQLLLRVLQRLSGMKGFSFQTWNFSENALFYFKKETKKLKSLKEISIVSQTCNYPGLCVIKRTLRTVPQLNKLALSLRNCRITEERIERFFNSLKNMKRLKELYLDIALNENSSHILFSKLKNIPEILEGLEVLILNFNGCSIEDDAALEIANTISNNRKLKAFSVFLTNCKNISAKVKDELKNKNGFYFLF